VLVAVNLCTLFQTANEPVPSLGSHPHDYTGGPMRGGVPTLHPPYPSTGQSYTFNMAISKMRNTATPHYITVRVSTTSDSQLQNTATSYYSAVRIRMMSGMHTLTPHLGSLGAHVYHQALWCTTVYYRNPASRTPTVILVILINLVTHGY
jgi:hypothetical protein